MYKLILNNEKELTMYTLIEGDVLKIKVNSKYEICDIEEELTDNNLYGACVYNENNECIGSINKAYSGVYEKRELSDGTILGVYRLKNLTEAEIKFLELNRKIENTTNSVIILTDNVKYLTNKVDGVVDIDKLTLEELKDYRILLSKNNLKKFLYENPITSTCHDENGSRYSVTEEKQALLVANLKSTEIAIEMGYTPTISWNTSEDVCTYDWTLDQLKTLALEISTYVRPYITQQQTIETNIRKATNKDEVMEIDVTFSLIG